MLAINKRLTKKLLGIKLGVLFGCLLAGGLANIPWLFWVGGAGIVVLGGVCAVLIAKGGKNLWRK